MAARITQVSPRGCRWTAMLEGGHHLKAYKDTNGTWTISAGVTYYSPGKRVKKGDTLTDLAASEALFRLRLAEFEGAVDAYTRDDINQYEFDAFTDAAYNIGIEAFRSSTFLKRFNRRDSIDSICDALSWFKYETIDGKPRVNQGLIERRLCEIYLLRNSLFRIQGGKELR